MKINRYARLVTVLVAMVGLLASASSVSAQTSSATGKYKPDGEITRYMYTSDISNYCKAIRTSSWNVWWGGSQWGCADVGGAGAFWIDNNSACIWKFGSFNLLGAYATSSYIACLYYS